MPRAQQRVNYSTFAGGKLSDVNPVSQTPPNVARTLLNVDVDLNGKVGRRLGIEPEDNFNLPTDVNNSASTWLSGMSLTDLQDVGIDFYEWTNVDNQPDLNYFVVRLGDSLYVYDQNGAALSDTLTRVIDISSFGIDSTSGTFDFQATPIKGYLVCSGQKYEPFYISYDFNAGTWATALVDLKVRDFEGLDDGLENDERPTTLSTAHQYNLLNQGWLSQDPDFDIAKGWNPFQSRIGKYPSNADIVYLGNTTFASTGNPNWLPTLITQHDSGSTAAPKGHYIIDPFDPASRGEVSGITGLTTEVAPTYRPRAVATFAGRVWYGSYNGQIFYSKIIESERDLGKCHPEQDPTAEDLNQVLDTDGGTLKILGIGEVLKMSPLGDALVIMGTGGIWVVSGGDSGFTATTQFVDNISKVKVSSYRSVVEVESSVLFWSYEGIFAVKRTERGFTADSISLGRIDRDYEEIPLASKGYVQGSYDRIQKKVYWCFSYYTEDPEVDIRQKYTDALVYSTLLDAFWDYRFSNEGYLQTGQTYPIVAGMFGAPTITQEFVDEDVTAVVRDTTNTFNSDILNSDTYPFGNCTAVIVTPDLVYMADGAGGNDFVIAYNKDDGTEAVEEFSLSGVTGTNIICGCYQPLTNLIYLFDETGTDVYTVDPTDNSSEAITTAVASGTKTDATVGADGSIYILYDTGTGSDQVLHKYTSDLSTQVWTTNLTGVFQEASALVYVASEDKFFTAGKTSNLHYSFSVDSSGNVSNVEQITLDTENGAYCWDYDVDENVLWTGNNETSLTKRYFLEYVTETVQSGTTSRDLTNTYNSDILESEDLSTGNTTGLCIVDEYFYMPDGQNNSGTAGKYRKSNGNQVGGNISLTGASGTDISCCVYQPITDRVYFFDKGGSDVYTLNPFNDTSSSATGVVPAATKSDATVDSDGFIYILYNTGPGTDQTLYKYSFDLSTQIWGPVSLTGISQDASSLVYVESEGKFFTSNESSNVHWSFTLDADGNITSSELLSGTSQGCYGWDYDPEENVLWTANAEAFATKRYFLEYTTSGLADVTVSVSVTNFTGSDRSTRVALMLPDSSDSYRHTFAQFSSRTFKDWAGLSSSDIQANSNYSATFPVASLFSGGYSSVVESLPQTLGEVALEKQSTYLYSYFDYIRRKTTLTEGLSDSDAEFGSYSTSPRRYIRLLFTEMSHDNNIYDLTVAAGSASLNGTSDGVRLTGLRYYDSEANPHPSQSMTAPALPVPFVATSCEVFSNLAAWNAFNISDLSDSSRWIADTDNPEVPPVFIDIDLGSGNEVAPTRVDITPDGAVSSGYFPTAFRVQGSNTGDFTGEEVTYYVATGLTSGWTNNTTRTFNF